VSVSHPLKDSFVLKGCEDAEGFSRAAYDHFGRCGPCEMSGHAGALRVAVPESGMLHLGLP